MAVSALSEKMSTKHVTKKRANSDKNVTPVRNRQNSWLSMKQKFAKYECRHGLDYTRIKSDCAGEAD
jgi:hypothetical protein